MGRPRLPTRAETGSMSRFAWMAESAIALGWPTPWPIKSSYVGTVGNNTTYVPKHAAIVQHDGTSLPATQAFNDCQSQNTWELSKRKCAAAPSEWQFIVFDELTFGTIIIWSIMCVHKNILLQRRRLKKSIALLQNIKYCYSTYCMY